VSDLGRLDPQAGPVGDTGNARRWFHDTFSIL
jgi:hypothetical protein